jgi:thioredoxin 1
MATLKMIDLWAPWCGPCRQLSPMLEQLQHKFGEQLEIEKINVDEDAVAVEQYQVRGIPTVVFIKNGDIVERVIGLKTFTEYEELITQYI